MIKNYDKMAATQKDYEHITLIIRDAKKLGLDREVSWMAEKIVKETGCLVDAYVMAYGRIIGDEA